MELEVVWNAGATLGEGPIWYDDRLYWVDIEEGRLHISSNPISVWRF